VRTACLLRKRNRKGGRKRRFGLSCPAAGGEEIRAPEEKELRGSGAWSFFLQQEVARVGNRGELQQQEVARVGDQRWLQSRNRAETEPRQRKKRKGISQGLVCDFRKLQGPLGKNKFNHYSRAQT
jgi:hypothetical protein